MRGKFQNQALHMDRAMETRYQPEPPPKPCHKSTGMMSSGSQFLRQPLPLDTCHCCPCSSICCCFHLPLKPLRRWTLLIGQPWVTCLYPSVKRLGKCSFFWPQTLVIEGFFKHGEVFSCWTVQGRQAKEKYLLLTYTNLSVC